VAIVKKSITTTAAIN